MAVAVLVAILISIVVAAPGGCDFGDTLPGPAFEALLQRMQSKGFSSEKLEVLAAWGKNNTYGLASNQTVGIVKQLGMTSDRAEAINSVNKFILTLECSGIVSIIKTLGFSREKLEVLKVLVTLANEADLKINNESIVEQFGMSSDKEAARKIIREAKPRSCLFGPADIPRFAFIIDVSGSMDEKFQDQDGTVYTRLQYVQKDLIHVMHDTVKPDQEFNIIKFSSSANAWRPGVVPATNANVESASNYTRGLVANGYTYVLPALKLAFSDPKVLGVYFLSDGEPTDRVSYSLEFAASLKKPIHTIAFKAPKAGSQFLFQLAQASVGGTFRNIV